MSNSIRPHIGRPLGSKNATMQNRAVRTRETILAVAARYFDTDGYGNTSMNGIIHAVEFARGAIYYHFPSKESIAEQLVLGWNHTITETISDATSSGSSTTADEKLTAIFTSVAHSVAADTNLRAGMKLTLEPTIDTADAFARWVDAISDIIDTAIRTSEIPDTPTAHRLAWNLCAGTIGATHASDALHEDIDLETRIGDTVAAHIKSVSAWDSQQHRGRNHDDYKGDAPDLNQVAGVLHSSTLIHKESPRQ